MFDLDGLEVEPIRDEQTYVGQRALLRAYLGKARMRLQVDFGSGDVLHTGPEEVDMPTLIDRIPRPRVRAYPREATVAEELEAMVHLGRRNRSAGAARATPRTCRRPPTRFRRR